MTRDEMIRTLRELPGLDPIKRAAALIAIRLAPEAEIVKASKVIEAGLPLLQSGDTEGLIALLRSQGMTEAIEADVRAVLDDGNHG